MEKRFKTEDVLSVYTGKLLGGMEGIYEVMSHLTQQGVYTHQLPGLFAPCKRGLAEQLAVLRRPKMRKILAKMETAFRSTNGKNRQICVNQYVKGLKVRLGRTLALSPMDDAVFTRRTRWNRCKR